MDASQENSKDAQAHICIEDGVGLGIGIVEIERMRRVLARTPRFKERAFTENERVFCEKSKQPVVAFAMRFAAKQAVLKALDSGFWQGIALRDIEVLRPAKGRPQAELHAKAKALAVDMGVLEIPLSLSFTHTEAVACALAITENSQSAARKRIDPKQKLSRQFKEARLLLDDLPAKQAGE